MLAPRLLPALLVLLPTLAVAQQVSTPAGGTNNAPQKVSPAPVPSTAAPAQRLATPAEHAQAMVAKAIGQFNADKPDDAFNSLNEALRLDPRCAEAYLFRGAIYSNKKQYQQAEADFKAAVAINPAPMYRVQLAELKFMQKQYDGARAEFVTFENDETVGELSKFKVFLCDLYGGHPDVAKKEYDALNATMSGPAYYFANVVWSVTNKNYDDARSWYASAVKIYPGAKIGPFSKCLTDLGLLPIPGSPAPAK